MCSEAPFSFWAITSLSHEIFLCVCAWADQWKGGEHSVEAQTILSLVLV